MGKKKKTKKASRVANLKDFTSSSSSDDLVWKSWRRAPSPPPSSHSSHHEDFDPSKSALERNKTIAILEAERQATLPKWQLLEEASYSRNDTFDAQLIYYEGDISDPALSEPYINPNKVQHAIRQILQDNLEKHASFIETVGGIEFCYERFQRALQIKWDLIKLQRYEEILGGRSELPVIPAEWEDYEGQFASIYGPMDKTNESYETLLLAFKAQRFKMYKEIIEGENTVIRGMLESGKSMSEWKPLELETKSKRLQLEEKLKAISEANLDINPYSNGTGMDFFVLPRPVLPITVYTVQPKEYDNLVEFQRDHQDHLHMIEGYNAAICDVECTHPTKVLGDMKRRRYFKGLDMKCLINKNAYEQWYRTLGKLKKEILQYPLGAEAMWFMHEYRENEALMEEETVFGRYSDERGVRKVPDVFFPQRLGKDGRIILFPSVFEGIIVTPDEILLRIWTKIKFLLEQNKRIKVENLVEKYEKFFGQQLYALNWGFSGVEDFIEYSFNNFPQELALVKCVEEDEIEAETVDEEQDDDANWEDVDDEEKTGDEKATGGDDLLSQNLWNVLDEGLPENYVFKQPDHFDMM